MLFLPLGDPLKQPDQRFCKFLPHVSQYPFLFRILSMSNCLITPVVQLCEQTEVGLRSPFSDVRPLFLYQLHPGPGILAGFGHFADGPRFFTAAGQAVDNLLKLFFGNHRHQLQFHPWTKPRRPPLRHRSRRRTLPPLQTDVFICFT